MQRGKDAATTRSLGMDGAGRHGLSISGEDHYVVYSNNLQNFIAGIPFVIEVGP